MKPRIHVDTATIAVFCSFLIVGLLGMYLKMELLSGEWLSIARFLGKTHADQISSMQRLGFYFNGIAINLILAPLIGTIIVSTIFRRHRVGVATCISVIVSIMLFYELRAQADVGQYVSRHFFIDSLRFGISNPSIVGDYATPASLIKLAMIIGILLAVWLLFRIARRKEYAGDAHQARFYRLVLAMPAVSIWIVAVLLAPISFAHQLHGSLLNASSTGRVVRALLGPDEYHGMANLSFDQALAAMHVLTRTPSLDARNAFVGSERGANVLVFIMETGPARALDFATSGRDLPGVGQLYDRSFVAKRQYTTYPYTSNAVYSILSGLYPRGRRRLLDSLQHTSLNALMTAVAGNVPLRGVYVPSLYLSEDDDQMFSAFGANKMFVSDQHAGSPLRAVAESRANQLISHLAESGGSFDKQSWDLLHVRLVDDFLALAQMETDITSAVHAHQRFCVAYLPQVAHGPWIALHNEPTVVERGHDLMLLEDQWLKELVDELRDLGQLQNTIIVFTADHGIRTRAEDPSLEIGKISDYMFRVPLVIYAPRALERTTLIDAPSSHIDIAPTVLALLGDTNDAKRMEGVPLWQRDASDRIYMWAGSYGGVNGFEENGNYYMRQELSGETFESNYEGFKDAFPVNTLVGTSNPTSAFVNAELLKAGALQETLVSNWIRDKSH